MISKKGVFFSTDALIALSIIFMAILMAYPIIGIKMQQTEVNDDLMFSLSSLKIGEFNSPYAQSLILDGTIKNVNKSVLEQIGELYLTNATIAEQLGNELLTEIDPKLNVGIWFGDNLIASKNLTSFENANSIDVVTQVITSLQEGAGATGFAARSYLSNKMQSKYYYFGGYIGDGNITQNIEYDGNISSAELEISISQNFSLYVNNVLVGDYNASPSEFIPQKYSIPTESFSSGMNSVEIRGIPLSITGGYLKINYEATNVEFGQTEKQYLPGIKGIINLYHGISIPAGLSSMEIFLNYSSEYKTFMTVGNKTIYNATPTGETTYTIDNSVLSNLLNYSQLSNNTIPFRFGMENISLVGNFTGNADVVLITDTSGSMDWRLDSDSTGTARSCSDEFLTAGSTKRISLAKCIDKDFVATILEGEGNRVALVSFSTSANNYVDLTDNTELLNNTIDAYGANGGTCISCAINRARQILESSSNSSTRRQYIITMTDGVPNYRSTPICYNLMSMSNTSTSIMGVGEDGASISYGQEWNTLTSASGDLNAIDLYNSTFGFAVGPSYKFYRLSGSTWTEVFDLGSQAMEDIDLYNNTFGFAVGSSGKIARLSGSTWSEHQDLGSMTLTGVKILNNTWAFAVADNGEIHRWSGSTWSEYQDTGNNGLNAIDLYNSTFGFAVGDSGKIFRWSGSTWSEHQDLGSMTLTDIDIYNSTLAFLTTSNDRIYQWSGSTWSLVYTSSAPLETIKIINSTLGFAAGDSYGGVIRWSGSTWTREFPSFVFAGNSSSGISCGDEDSCSQAQSAAMLNANYSACVAKQMTNATIHSVGFGPIATCSFATATLQSIASCGNGSFYSSTNATLLQQFYQAIANSILQVSYSEQTSQVTGNVSTELYPSSYISFTYAKPSQVSGMILSLEEEFSNATTGYFTIPANTTLIEANVISYSGPRWTSLVKINGKQAYNLSKYGNNYLTLGDPHSYIIPVSLINLSSINEVNVQTGVAPTNVSVGSESNKIIYKVAKNITSYSPIALVAEGCIWSITFDDDTNSTINIPASYSGTNQCSYTQQSQSFDTNDAIQYAAYNILKSLDLDTDGKIDVDIDSDNLQISQSQITGIPFTWATEVQIRKWL